MQITLCGSTKFKDEFDRANKHLTLSGNCVYSCAIWRHSGDPITEAQGHMLDLVHLQKIEASNVIVVVGHLPDGSLYIGEGLRRELAWAAMHDIPILVWSDTLVLQEVKFAQPADAFSWNGSNPEKQGVRPCARH